MRNSALHYLGRYTATSAQLRRIMNRRIDRSLAVHGGDRAEAAEWLDELVGQLVEAGYLNDRAYALARCEELAARGASARMIRVKLRAKGLKSEDIDKALEALTEASEDPELQAAVAYARRRRLGPFRRGDSPDYSGRRKEYAALARQGFPMGLVRKVIDAASEEELLGGDRT